MLTSMAFTRYGCVLFTLGFLIGCDVEQREVTPYGYASEDPPGIEVPQETMPPQQRPLMPWLPQSENSSSAPADLGALFPAPTGPASLDEEQAFGMGLNGVGRRFQRRVVADQQVIGLHCRDSNCIALSSQGGIFTSTPFGDWSPGSPHFHP